MHQWMGRAIALLGFVQVPLGLTLYGSPAYLFILYALWGAFLLLLYFILTYRNLPVGAFDDDGTYISYVTESTDDGRSRRSRLGALATAGAAGAGLAALRRRSKSRKRERETERMEREEMRESHRSRSRDRRAAAASGRSSSYLEEEKFYDEPPPKEHTWRNRLLTAAATLGGVAAAKKIFGQKKTPEESDVGSGYSYPTQGPHRVSQSDISRVEEGRVPASPMTPGDRYRRIQESEVAGGSAVTGSLPPRRPTARTRRSGGSIDSYDSRDSFDYVEETTRPSGGEEKSHKARNGLLALGLMGFIKHKMNQRRDRKEEDRITRLREEEVEQERLARADSQRRKYTGDGFEPYTPTSPRSRRGSRRISSSHGVDDNLVHHGSNPELSRQSYPPRPPPSNTGMASRIDTVGEGSHPSTGLVPPPGGAPPAPHDPLPMGRGGPLGPPAPINDSTSYSSSPLTSPTRDAASRRNGGRKRRSAAALAGTGAAIGGAAVGAAALASRSRSRSRSRSEGRRRRQEQQDDPLSSPPVSVKVKMHKDGRHVTLRRLNEQEAAEEREARRRERRGESVGGGTAAGGKSSTGRSRRASTLSDVSGSEDRWRRRSAAMAGGAGAGPGDDMDIKARAAAIAKEIDIEHEAAVLPPPPPGPPPSQQQQAPQYTAPYPMPGPPAGPPPPPQHQPPPPQQYQYPPSQVGSGLQPPHTPFNPKPFNTTDVGVSPPRVPGVGSGMGSGMGSPYETGPSDMSANYDSNRRRRRMERAAQAARGRGSGSRVEFT